MESPSKSPIAWVAGAIAVIVWLIRLPLSHVRFFDPDEFQHTHHAWYISLGQVPYRDFVDHHTPLYHAFLAPLFWFHDVAASAPEGEAMLFLARRISWILSAVIIVLAFELARRWRGSDVAFVTAALLSTTIMFVDKTLEIRPDLLTMIFWLGALILILDGIRTDGTNPRRDMVRFVGSGICVSLGLLTSQKLLFAGPGLTATMLWFLFDSRVPLPTSRKLTLLVAQVVGLIIPLAAATGFFASKGALSVFLHYNLGANAGLNNRFSPLPGFRTLLRQNPFYMSLGLAGLIPVVMRMTRPESMRRGDYLIVLNLAGLTIGLFINPVPYPQSFLTFMPLLAMLGAALVVNGIREIAHVEGGVSRDTVILAGITVLLALFCVRYAVPLIQIFAKPFWVSVVVALALAVFFYRRKASADPVIAVTVAFLAVFPIAELLHEFKATSKAQLAAIESVYANSLPTDTFLDGFTGFGMFRPHASRFWFLHTEIQAMMTPEEKLEVVDGIVSGRIAPKIIGYDPSLKRLSPDLNKYIQANYSPLDSGPLYIRNR